MLAGPHLERRSYIKVFNISSPSYGEIAGGLSLSLQVPSVHGHRAWTGGRIKLVSGTSTDFLDELYTEGTGLYPFFMRGSPSTHPFLNLGLPGGSLVSKLCKLNPTLWLTRTRADHTMPPWAYLHVSGPHIQHQNP